MWGLTAHSSASTLSQTAAPHRQGTRKKRPRGDREKGLFLFCRHNACRWLGGSLILWSNFRVRVVGWGAAEWQLLGRHQAFCVAPDRHKWFFISFVIIWGEWVELRHSDYRTATYSHTVQLCKGLEDCDSSLAQTVLPKFEGMCLTLGTSSLGNDKCGNEDLKAECLSPGESVWQGQITRREGRGPDWSLQEPSVTTNSVIELTRPTPSYTRHTSHHLMSSCHTHQLSTTFLQTFIMSINFYFQNSL